MENELSVESVLNHKNNYNLAMPFVESRQVNPYFKMSVSLLQVDLSEDAGQMYKVGVKCIPHGKEKEWIDLYSLTKPFLQKLATQAGIQFAPGSGDVVKVDENTWKASAFGALKLPDGTVRTSSNFKVIDLLTEEKKYRIAYEEKAVSGIRDFKAAKDASERYAGEWRQTGEVNEKGYPVKIYCISETDRGKYVELSLVNAMAQLRANAPQKAATGAILRVIRDLTGVKGTYTLAELEKPFAVARMAFSPDYNDPYVKQMMLQQAMQSVGNLFGASLPVTHTIAIPQPGDIEDEIDLPEEPSAVQENNMHPAAPPGPQSVAPQSEDRTRDFCCDKCGDVIKENVWKYSCEKYDRPLCMKCQNIVRQKESGGGR